MFLIIDLLKSRQNNINVNLFRDSDHNKVPVQFQYISLIQVHSSTLLKCISTIISSTYLNSSTLWEPCTYMRRLSGNLGCRCTPKSSAGALYPEEFGPQILMYGEEGRESVWLKRGKTHAPTSGSRTSETGGQIFTEIFLTTFFSRFTNFF